MSRFNRAMEWLTELIEILVMPVLVIVIVISFVLAVWADCNARARMREDFPVGTVVQHKLNNATGVITGVNTSRVSVRFANNRGTFDTVEEYSPYELIATKKCLEDFKKEQQNNGTLEVKN